MTNIRLYRISKILTLLLFSFLVFGLGGKEIADSRNYFDNYNLAPILFGGIIILILFYPIINYWEILVKYKNGELSRFYYFSSIVIGMATALLVTILSFGIGLIFLIPYFILLAKNNIKTPTYGLTIPSRFNEKISKIKNLSNTEIMIISIIFGLSIGTILGYVYGKTHYFAPNGLRIAEEFKNAAYLSEFKFNYFLFSVGGIIIGCLMYLLLKRKAKVE